MLRSLSPQVLRDLVIGHHSREPVKQGTQTAIVLVLSVGLDLNSDWVPHIQQYTANFCPYAPRSTVMLVSRPAASYWYGSNGGHRHPMRSLSLWKDADPDIPILKQTKAENAKLQYAFGLSCADCANNKGGTMLRERHGRSCGGGGIVVYGGSRSADNVFLARAFGAHINEHLCHTRNFLAAGGA
jgi:hypothetical protein